MATSKNASGIVPDNAVNRPENVPLKHLAWAPMWVENSNAIFTIVGDPGDGKSWAGLKAAEVLHPDFDIGNVAFDIVEFMQLVVDDSIGQGEPIILEEASIEASAQDWHSLSNEVFRKVLDTWRHQNRMAIINLPNFQALEKGARRRTDAIIEMQEAKPWKGYSQAKIKEVNYNNISDHFSTPFPILEGKKRKYIRFTPPNEGLRAAYEKKKEEYTAELNEELLERLLSEEEDESESELTPQDVADDIIASDAVEEYISSNNGQRFVDRDLIELEYDIGQRKSRQAKKLLVKQLDLDVM
jgi:hypothetical protein